jgi:hypothetical protein
LSTHLWAEAVQADPQASCRWVTVHSQTPYLIFPALAMSISVLPRLRFCFVLTSESAKDYSGMGKKLGLSGKTVAYLIVLLKSVLQSLPDCFVHENVCAFPEGVIKLILGKGFGLNGPICFVFSIQGEYE